MVSVDPDADQVATPYAESLGEASHPGPFVCVDGVEGVVASGKRANFYDNRGDLVAGHDVDFTAGDDQVPGDDIEAVILQILAGQELAELSGGQPT